MLSVFLPPGILLLLQGFLSKISLAYLQFHALLLAVFPIRVELSILTYSKSASICHFCCCNVVGPLFSMCKTSGWWWYRCMFPEDTVELLVRLSVCEKMLLGLGALSLLILLTTYSSPYSIKIRTVCSFCLSPTGLTLSGRFFWWPDDCRGVCFLKEAVAILQLSHHSPVH